MGQVEKRVKRLARGRSDQFDSVLCGNRVHEAIDMQHEHGRDLRELIEIVEDAYVLAERRRANQGFDDPVRESAFDAAESLTDHVDELVDEVVAAALGDVLEHADDWTDVWDAEDVEAAKDEAREWLQDHREAAERADVSAEIKEAEN